MIVDKDNSLVSQVISEDEELKDEIRSLMRLAIAESKKMITHGSDNLKLNAIRNLMPAMVRALAVKTDTESPEVQAIKTMLEEMRGDGK